MSTGFYEDHIWNYKDSIKLSHAYFSPSKYLFYWYTHIGWFHTCTKIFIFVTSFKGSNVTLWFKWKELKLCAQTGWTKDKYLGSPGLLHGRKEAYKVLGTIICRRSHLLESLSTIISKRNIDIPKSLTTMKISTETSQDAPREFLLQHTVTFLF